MTWIALGCAAGGYALILLLVWAFQEKLIYAPTRDVFTDPRKAHGLDFEDLELVAEDGVRIRVWYTPAANPRAVLLFCHGNGGNLAHRVDVIKGYHDLGLSSLLFDYRGYGRSEGRPSEQGTYLDAQAAWDFLVDQRGIDPGRIILIGRSLGGPIAAHIAAKFRPAGLSLEAAATSAAEAGQQMFPFLPVSLLLRHRYDTVAWLRDVTCPVMVSHGTRDREIRFSHGQRLYEAAREPKRFVELHGDHLEAHIDGTPDYPRALSDFVDECLRNEQDQIAKDASESTRL